MMAAIRYYDGQQSAIVGRRLRKALPIYSVERDKQGGLLTFVAAWE
jgi:hypothetical protein